MEHRAFPQRKTPRLKTFDYTAGGVFCITICTEGKQKLFGHISDDTEPHLHPSPLGKIVENRIAGIPNAYPGVELLNWVVMPNHLHLLM